MKRMMLVIEESTKAPASVMLKIHCGDDLLFTGSGYTGTLFVETDMGCFPSENWTDFPETVLGWWVDAIKSMIIGRDGSTNTFLFMDGPYAIRCRKKRGILILSFERENTVALPDCETTLDTFCKAVRNAMESLIRKLYLCGRNDKTAPIRGYLKQLDSFLNLLSIVGFRAVDTDVCLTDAVL